MKSLVIGVRDLVRGEFVLIAHARNEAIFVRDTLPVCVRDLRIPLKDVQFVHLGSFDPETGEILACPHKVIPQDVYQWKAESEAEKLTDEQKASLNQVINSSKE